MTDKGLDKESIYGTCSCCEQIIYTHMVNNIMYLDKTRMCGSCVTGESAEYTAELLEQEAK